MAVRRGLEWLAKQQQKDGSWKFDGVSSDQIAATGLALLPFVAAGETHTTGDRYKVVVTDGLYWLTRKQNDDGSFDGSSSMYAHAIATIALCDVARVSKDNAVKDKAKRAVGYIVKAQGENGSWGYKAGTEGDTSITGWQIQALAAARLAEIEFDQEAVYAKADRFLEKVSSDNGARYGYREGDAASQSLTAVGLLSRYYLGTLSRRHPTLARGVAFLNQSPPEKSDFNIDYTYYGTLVIYRFGGDDWHKDWNPKVRDLLLELQDKSEDAARNGSWKKDMSLLGPASGRLGTTALAILTLQIYYRALPHHPVDKRISNDSDK